MVPWGPAPPTETYATGGTLGPWCLAPTSKVHRGFLQEWTARNNLWGFLVVSTAPEPTAANCGQLIGTYEPEREAYAHCAGPLPSTQLMLSRQDILYC